MFIQRLHLLIGLVVSLVVSNAHAQGLSGCVDSPENPAVVLVLLGLVASGVPRIQKHFKRRNSRTSVPTNKGA